MATVLDRLETLVREVISALRENSQLFGRVESVMLRVEDVLSNLEAQKAEANKIAETNTKAVVETQAAWRNALTVVTSWTQTRSAAVFGTALMNLFLAWLAHWMGVPLPFLPTENSAHVASPSLAPADPIVDDGRVQ